MNAHEWLSAIADLLQGGAAVGLAIIAVAGLNAWKKQKKYDREVDAAAEVMYHSFEFENQFTGARFPLERYPEAADQDAFKKIQLDRKSQALKDIGEQFNAMARALDKLALWHKDFCHDERKALQKAFGELQGAMQVYFGMNIHEKRYHEKVYGTPDDDFGKVVGENAEKIRAACRKLTR
jgi:hypothetical protein